MVITMAKLRMAHASTHGARKPLGPTKPQDRGPGGHILALTRTSNFSTLIFSLTEHSLAFISCFVFG